MTLEEVALVPQPVSVSPVRGSFAVGEGFRFLPGPGAEAVAERLADDIASRTAFTVEEVAPFGGQANLFLEVDESVGEKPESYRLEIGPDEIRCVGRDEAGLFYATRTLLQFLEQCHDGVVPGCVIVDAPALRFRMLHYDLAREQTCNMSYLKRVIDYAADHKYNMIDLYLEGRFAFPSHPDIGPPGVMTPQQAKDLDQYAAERFVELIPQVNCLAHMENILSLPAYKHLAEAGEPFQICPSHPEAVDFVTDLIEDVIPCFRSGFFHAGGDESWHLGECPKCAARAEEIGKGGIYAEHYVKVYDVLKRHGKRMMLWGDMMLQHERAMADVPHDVVVFDWHYQGSSPGTIERFLDAGFSDVFACPAVSGCGRISAPTDRWSENIWDFIADGAKVGAVGACTCAWELKLGHFFDNDWLAVLMGADRSWNPAVEDRAASLARYGREFYGLPDGLDLFRYFQDLDELRSLVFSKCPQGRPPVSEVGLWIGPLEPTAEKMAPFLDESLVRAVLTQAERLVERAEALRNAAVRHRETMAMLDFPPLAWAHGVLRTYNFAQAQRLRGRGGEENLRKALALLEEIEEHEQVIEKRLRRAVDDYGSSTLDIERLEDERSVLRTARRGPAAR